MFPFVGHTKIDQASAIVVKPSNLHGNGVFAQQLFKPGTVIEIAPAILMEERDKDILESTMLYSYYFVVGNKKFPVALGLGYSSLYNHSYSANAVYSISIKNASIKITAFKTIKPGEEITLNYNGDPNDTTTVYFEPDTMTP